jgi:hypothetical protein
MVAMIGAVVAGTLAAAIASRKLPRMPNARCAQTGLLRALRQTVASPRPLELRCLWQMVTFTHR